MKETIIISTPVFETLIELFKDDKNFEMITPNQFEFNNQTFIEQGPLCYEHPVNSLAI